MRYPILPVCLMLGALSLPTPMRADVKDNRGAELAALSASTEQELKGDILPFWMKYTRTRRTAGITASSERT